MIALECSGAILCHRKAGSIWLVHHRQLIDGPYWVSGSTEGLVHAPAETLGITWNRERTYTLLSPLMIARVSLFF